MAVGLWIESTQWRRPLEFACFDVADSAWLWAPSATLADAQTCHVRGGRQV